MMTYDIYIYIYYDNLYGNIIPKSHFWISTMTTVYNF